MMVTINYQRNNEKKSLRKYFKFQVLPSLTLESRIVPVHVRKKRTLLCGECVSFIELTERFCDRVLGVQHDESTNASRARGFRC